MLEREYGPYIVQPEAGYDFSILIDLENLPAEPEAKEELIRRVALLKRNAMAAPFERAFVDFAHRQEEASKFTRESAPEGVREGGDVMAVHYREEEAIYIKASHDRVTVIFSTIFREETDRIFGKIFLQEFVDARRRAIQNAPQVLFRNEPPLELQGIKGLSHSTTGEVGYVTFGTWLFACQAAFTDLLVLFPRHLTPQRRQESISHIQTFRDYFHYHIKASKVSSYGLDITKLNFDRHTSILECADGPQIFFKSSIERVQKMRRRRGKQRVDGHSKPTDRVLHTKPRALLGSHL